MSILVYTAHNEAQGEVSERSARRMIADGDVVPLYRRERERRVLVAIRRVLEEVATLSPSGISHSECIASAGQFFPTRLTARQYRIAEKVRCWAFIGQPALRHTQ